jgi:hypothetical protein
MKKMIIVLTLLLPLQSFAGWTSSFWFEPTLLCVAGGGAGYATAPKGSEAQNGAIGCAAGALIGYFVNSYYDKKFGTQYQGEIEDKTRSLEEYQAQQAQKVMRGEDEIVSLRVQTIIPGKKLPDGSVTSPSVREVLVLPGSGTRPGE